MGEKTYISFLMEVTLKTNNATKNNNSKNNGCGTALGDPVVIDFYQLDQTQMEY